MTVALIAQNHFALESLLRDKLGAALPEVSIGGFAEYVDLLDGKTSALPAIYVVYDGDKLTSGPGSPHQTLAGQMWQIVIVTAPDRTDGAGMDLTAAGALMAKTLSALSGQRLHDSLKPIVRRDDVDPILFGNGMLFIFLSYSQPIELR